MILSLGGHQAAGDRDRLEAAIRRLERASSLTIDLTRVSTIDSSLLGSLVRLFTLVKSRGGDVRLDGPPGPTGTVLPQ